MPFRRQQIIDGFIVDFYCPKLRIVIEIDGAVHDQRKEYDLKRDSILMQKKLKILRFTNSEVINDIHAVIKTILDHSPP